MLRRILGRGSPRALARHRCCVDRAVREASQGYRVAFDPSESEQPRALPRREFTHVRQTDQSADPELEAERPWIGSSEVREPIHGRSAIKTTIHQCPSIRGIGLGLTLGT